MPSIPNPFDLIGDNVVSSLTELAQSAFNQAMESLWDFSLSLLTGVLGVIDHLTLPNLDPRTGPLASVLPSTIWVGAVLLVLLSFLQLGKAAISGGGGLLHLFKGIGQYVVISACALGILATLVTAADAAARGILQSGLNIDSWQGIAAANSAWQNAVNGVSGAGLGLIALLGVLPAAIGLMVAALVRQASILVIAATIPILAAGLVAEATARWFWTGLRWMLALIAMTPAVAIVVSIGLKLAASASGAAGPSSADAAQQAVTAFIGAAVLLISVFCPLALFKLFAFMDPGTQSGRTLRTSLSDFGSNPGAAASSPAGSPGGGSSSSAVTPQEADASDSVDSRWASAISRLSLPHRVMSAGTSAAMSSAAPVLEATGVGAGADAGGYAPPGRAGGGQPGRADRGLSGTDPVYSGDDSPTAPPPPERDAPGPPDDDPGPSGGPRPPAPGGGSSGPAGAGAAQAPEAAEVAVIA